MSDQKTRTLQNTFITITLLMLVVSDYFHILPCFMLNSFLGCKVPLANPAILGPGARNCNFFSSGLFSKSIELSWRNTQEWIRLCPDQIEIWKCWLLMKGENQSTWRKPLGAEKRAYNELNPDMVRRWDSTLRHTGGREVIPPVHHPGSHSIHIELAGLKALLLTSKLNRHCLIFT